MFNKFFKTVALNWMLNTWRKNKDRNGKEVGLFWLFQAGSGYRAPSGPFRFSPQIKRNLQSAFSYHHWDKSDHPLWLPSWPLGITPNQPSSKTPPVLLAVCPLPKSGKPLLEAHKSSASVIKAGKEFHNGMVNGKKLNLKTSVFDETCVSFLS